MPLSIYVLAVSSAPPGEMLVAPPGGIRIPTLSLPLFKELSLVILWESDTAHDIRWLILSGQWLLSAPDRRGPQYLDDLQLSATSIFLRPRSAPNLPLAPVGLIFLVRLSLLPFK